MEHFWRSFGEWVLFLGIAGFTVVIAYTAIMVVRAVIAKVPSRKADDLAVRAPLEAYYQHAYNAGNDPDERVVNFWNLFEIARKTRRTLGVRYVAKALDLDWDDATSRPVRRTATRRTPARIRPAAPAAPAAPAPAPRARRARGGGTTP